MQDCRALGSLLRHFVATLDLGELCLVGSLVLVFELVEEDLHLVYHELLSLHSILVAPQLLYLLEQELFLFGDFVLRL